MPAVASFTELVERIEEGGRHRLGIQLRDHVGLVDFAPGALTLCPLRPLGADFARELAGAAEATTGVKWTVTVAEGGGDPSLHEQGRMAEERARAAVLEEPGIKALLAEFPDAQLESLHPKGHAHAQPR